eukprot:sb/3461930/
MTQTTCRHTYHKHSTNIVQTGSSWHEELISELPPLRVLESRERQRVRQREKISKQLSLDLRSVRSPQFASVGLHYLYSAPEQRLPALTKGVLVGLPTLALTLLLDYMFYERLVVVFWNFLSFNMAGSAVYGAHPWHWYVTQGIPAIAGTHAILVAVCFLARRDYPRQFLLVAMVTVLFFSCVAHKEFRFIQHLLPLVMIWAGLGLHWISRRVDSSTLYLGIMFHALANIIPAIYLGFLHQRGTISVVGDLAGGMVQPGQSVHFLTPCHATPFHSHIHIEDVDLRFLDCSPGGREEGELHEEGQFYSDPVAWWDKKGGRADWVVVFEEGMERLHGQLKKDGYSLAKRYFYAHLFIIFNTKHTEFQLARSQTNSSISGLHYLYSAPEQRLPALTKGVLVGLPTLALTLLLDYLFYGRLVVVFWNFLSFNMAGSAVYGAHPWHWYVTQGIPAIAGTHAILVAVCFLARRDYPRQFLLVAMVTVLFFSCVAHKEFRFIQHLLPIVMIWAGLGLHWISRRVDSSTLYLGIMFHALANIIPAIYLGFLHQRGTISVVGDLAGGMVQPGQSVHFLTPCHATPFHSHIHIEDVDLRFLDCSPGGREEGELHEEGQFYSDPVAWWDKKGGRADWVVVFEEGMERLHGQLKKDGYSLAKRYFYAHLGSAQGIPAIAGTHAILVAVCFLARRDYPRQFLLVAMVTVLFFSCVAHKEFRFIQHLLPIVMIWAGLGLHWISRRVDSSTLYLGIMFHALANIIPAIYLGFLHQRGTISVVGDLAGGMVQPGQSVHFLTPCHATPFHSHIHIEDVDLRFLDCSPGGREEGELHEEGQFYSDPVAWWDKKGGRADWVVVFEEGMERLHGQLKKDGYSLAKRYFYAHLEWAKIANKSN